MPSNPQPPNLQSARHGELSLRLGLLHPFILVATFTMLNLFIAIIVNAMQSYNEREKQNTGTTPEQPREHTDANVHAEVLALRDEIRALKTLLLVRGESANPAGTQQPPY